MEGKMPIATTPSENSPPAAEENISLDKIREYLSPGQLRALSLAPIQKFDLTSQPRKPISCRRRIVRGIRRLPREDSVNSKGLFFEGILPYIICASLISPKSIFLGTILSLGYLKFYFPYSKLFLSLPLQEQMAVAAIHAGYIFSLTILLFQASRGILNLRDLSKGRSVLNIAGRLLILALFVVGSTVMLRWYTIGMRTIIIRLLQSRKYRLYVLNFIPMIVIYSTSLVGLILFAPLMVYPTVRSRIGSLFAVGSSILEGQQRAESKLTKIIGYCIICTGNILLSLALTFPFLEVMGRV